MPRLTGTTAFALGLGLLAACRAGAPPERTVVDVVARGLTFEAPDSVPAGWITFRFRNESPMVHFALIQRLPEGKTVAHQQTEVAPVFQQGMDLLNQGQPEAAMAKFAELPAWFSEIVFLGGPGFVSGGGTATTTVYLEPGTYMLECYVKTGGVFHSVNPDPATYGMVHQFVVTAPLADTIAPEPTTGLLVSSTRGIDGPGDLTSGDHIVEVRFEDQTGYEHFLGHDVHLVRLADDTDLDRLGGWMDWRLPDGLETPAPATFLGGVNAMPAKSRAFLELHLTPGRYAWIAQVPDPAARGMLREFTVRE